MIEDGRRLVRNVILLLHVVNNGGWIGNMVDELENSKTKMGREEEKCSGALQKLEFSMDEKVLSR